MPFDLPERRFCFGEWSFSSGDSYEWDRFLKVGEMRSEEASKLLVQTEMYVSKYTCKGRAPLLRMRVQHYHEEVLTAWIRLPGKSEFLTG
ncbi:hypothetical protein GQ457_06G017100 [Hibiscus cannabinus]